MPPLYWRHPAETLLGREIKYDFDALPDRLWMANFYLPLSPLPHDQVPEVPALQPDQA